MNRFLFTCDLY